jgi:hypothetical protein
LKEPNSQLSSEPGSCYLRDQEAYVIPTTLNNATQCELQKYENNYKSLNLITTALGKNVYDIVSHLEIAHDV